MTDNKTALYAAARQTLVAYFKQTHLNGFRLLYDIRQRKYQRLVWCTVMTVNIAFGFFMIIEILNYFKSEPVRETLMPELLDIRDVPFPAVAVCSANRLSRRAVQQYAQELANMAQDERDINYWLRKLEMLIAYFDPNAVENFDEAIAFQNELEYMVPAFNASAVLKWLAPKCQDQLIACWLADKLQNCREIFSLKATGDGFCCIFNLYRSPADHPGPYRHNATILETGLKVLLNASERDFFKTVDSSTAYTVKIFNQDKTPDVGIGNILTMHVSIHEAAAIELKTKARVAGQLVRTYPISKRWCFFRDELADRGFGKLYSQTECMYRCRIRSVVDLCNCLPFHAAWQLTIVHKHIGYCTLAHIECLKRYQITWLTIRPHAALIHHYRYDKHEYQDSINCEHCLPLCTHYHYEYRKFTMNLRSIQTVAGFGKIYKTPVPEPKDDDNEDAYSSLVVFYRSQYAKQYRFDVTLTWYQILSLTGGILSINIGCSIISGIEFIYFICYRSWINYTRMRNNS